MLCRFENNSDFSEPKKRVGGNKKGPPEQTFLFTAGLSSAGAVRKHLKKTLYFQVGNRCSCPKVLSSRHFRLAKV